VRTGRIQTTHFVGRLIAVAWVACPFAVKADDTTNAPAPAAATAPEITNTPVTATAPVSTNTPPVAIAPAPVTAPAATAPPTTTTGNNTGRDDIKKVPVWPILKLSLNYSF
jgi:hypothetical protein